MHPVEAKLLTMLSHFQTHIPSKMENIEKLDLLKKLEWLDTCGGNLIKVMLKTAVFGEENSKIYY